MKEDKHFEKLYSSIWQDQRTFPTELGLKTSLSECTLDDRGALCFRKRLWVPEWEPLRTALIQKSHDSHVTGHPGRNNTLAIISRNFYWPKMSTMVRRFCRNCDVCGRSHVRRTRRQGLLLPLPIPDRFHSELSIDFMTDLPVENDKSPRYLMVITDRLLKSVTLEAMNSMDAESSADRFLQCHFAMSQAWSKDYPPHFIQKQTARQKGLTKKCWHTFEHLFHFLNSNGQKCYPRHN